MMVFPNYFKRFKCIAKDCKHSCCKGWDIYIDKDSYNNYNSSDRPFCKLISKNINPLPEPHFSLINNKCPFLNSNNLCEIIINLGEDYLCDICKEHPRFYNELPNRTECGLGLSCEEAARIILGQKEKATLLYSEQNNTDDEIILSRDKIISILQNRSIPISERLNRMLIECNTVRNGKSIEKWIDIFINFERLDPEWTNYLIHLKNNYNNINTAEFNEYIANREYEYEQFVVYLIYRYYANSFDLYDASAIAVFADLCYRLIYLIGASIYSTNKKFEFDDHINLIRMFSAEIEYSDTIINQILNEIYE